MSVRLKLNFSFINSSRLYFPVKCIPLLYHRAYSSTPLTDPRHFISIADLTPTELSSLITRSSWLKNASKSKSLPVDVQNSLKKRTVALIFSKRSTRTRVSCEAATAALGGNPLFLGSTDIQLGVKECIKDTSKVVSSMACAMIIRTHSHQEIIDVAADSSVPVINSLTDTFHPLQALADFLTLYEEYGKDLGFYTDLPHLPTFQSSVLNFSPLKIAWIGDANNVLFDIAIAAIKLGAEIAIATPKDYPVSKFIIDNLNIAIKLTDQPGKYFLTHNPKEALVNADVVITDTWVSMGQEAESKLRRKAFSNYRVTQELITSGHAKDNWRFMHCLPRQSDEVDDQVFYGDRSLVWKEAENRLWTTMAVLEAFVVKNGTFS